MQKLLIDARLLSDEFNAGLNDNAEGEGNLFRNGKCGNQVWRILIGFSSHP